MREDTNYTLSHNSKDASCFTHKAKFVRNCLIISITFEINFKMVPDF